MDRRTFLQAAGAAGIVGAAGCLDGGDSESPSTTPNDEAVSDDSYEAGSSQTDGYNFDSDPAKLVTRPSGFTGQSYVAVVPRRDVGDGTAMSLREFKYEFDGREDWAARNSSIESGLRDSEGRHEGEFTGLEGDFRAIHNIEDYIEKFDGRYYVRKQILDDDIGELYENVRINEIIEVAGRDEIEKLVDEYGLG